MEGPFDRDHAPPIGVAERPVPGLRVVTAGNAGPMTFTGTRSYILGEGEVAVIDPGPDDPAHAGALLGALAPGERVAAILVTHAHRDHSGAARRLAAATGAEILAHGGPPAEPDGAAPGLGGVVGLGLGGGEGIDHGFAPDRRIGEGDRVAGPGWSLEALHLPGHLGDHLCFAWAEGGALFSGDLVMAWATTVISPPGGDLAAFMASLGRLAERGERTYWPGHGGPVRDPAAMVAWQRAHREARSARILAALDAGPKDVPALVAAVYPGLEAPLAAAAGRTVLAHLLALIGAGEVAATPAPGATFRRV